MKYLNLKNMDKAEVLRVLWINSKNSFSLLVGSKSAAMGYEEAKLHLDLHLESGTRIDYLCGVLMKLDFREEILDLRLYNRDVAGAEDVLSEIEGFEIIEMSKTENNVITEIS